MKIKIYDYLKRPRSYLGYIESSVFDAKECYEICQWELHHDFPRPSNLHARGCKPRRGICFRNPETKEMWMVLSIGWMRGSQGSIQNYAEAYQGKLFWLEPQFICDSEGGM